MSTELKVVGNTERDVQSRLRDIISHTSFRRLLEKDLEILRLTNDRGVWMITIVFYELDIGDISLLENNLVKSEVLEKDISLSLWKKIVDRTAFIKEKTWRYCGLPSSIMEPFEKYDLQSQIFIGTEYMMEMEKSDTSRFFDVMGQINTFSKKGHTKNLDTLRVDFGNENVDNSLKKDIEEKVFTPSRSPGDIERLRRNGICSYDACEFCKKSHLKLKLCGACKSVWYCTVDCQKNHWGQHRMKCRAKIVKDYIRKYHPE
jgi:hypothetical protein